MEWDDDGIREAISRLGEPGRSVLAALLARVKALEGEVAELRGGAGDPGSPGGRVEGLEEAIEEAIEGAGRGGLEETVERVDKLEEVVGEMREEIRDLQNDVEDARG